MPTPISPPTGFAANGAISTLNLSNAAMTESTRYNARLQPLTIQAAFGSATLLSLQYSYCSNYADVNASQTCSSNNGNLWQQAITFPAIGTAASFSETQQYQYNDPSNRITQAATSNSSWIQQFGYDATGNGWVAANNNLPALTQETPLAQSWFTAANRINGWTYDETGNILQIGTAPAYSRIFTYDAENRQITATINGGAPSSYVYDGEGRRVQATTASGTTTFVYDAAGRLAQEYSTAAPTDTGTSYMFADHLGSTRLITDGSGNIKKRFDYLPFGEEILASYGSRTSAMGYNTGVGTPDIERLKFTSKERDSETGLDYFGFRYLSSAQGRWTSPDQPFADQHLEDPQSWNMYGYVRNNPLKNTDPDGRACSSLIGNTGSDFCQRAAEYSSARFDADPRVSSQTRFFAAAAAVSEAVANVDGPGFISSRFVSPATATFLENNIGQDLEQLNSRTVEDVRNGSLTGPDLDARLVHTEQTEIQKQLDSLNKSDPTAYAKTISEINGVLNPSGVKAGIATIFPTDKAFGGVLDSVRKNLGRNIDFSKQSDREAIGNALIQHVRQKGGCDVSNNVTVCK